MSCKKILAFVFLLSVTNVWTQSPSSFSKAKQMATVLFQEHPITLYCHCPYVVKEIILEHCGMSSALDKVRAHRLEWEHIMAAGLCCLTPCSGVFTKI